MFGAEGWDVEVELKQVRFPPYPVTLSEVKLTGENVPLKVFGVRIPVLVKFRVNDFEFVSFLVKVLVELEETTPIFRISGAEKFTVEFPPRES